MKTHPQRPKKPKTRPQPSKPKLRVASVHVGYELRMLHKTHEMLASLLPAWNDPNRYYLRCALSESHTIHARALLHFLWPEGRIDDDDVLAKDYLPGGTWTVPGHPTCPTSLADVRPDVNSQIAHITYRRPDPGSEKKWPVSAITIELDAHLRTWERAVRGSDPSLLDPVWPEDPARLVLPPVAGRSRSPFSESTTTAVSVTDFKWLGPAVVSTQRTGEK
jgi:hypothetical protein